MTQTAPQPAPKPRRFDRHLILARARAYAIGRAACARSGLAHELLCASPSAAYLSHLRCTLAYWTSRESRIDHDQRLLALPFAERRAAVGAPFTQLYEEATP
jgi:hypothetical protein